MSSVYATEPAPSGRVVLDTTHGPVQIQLYARECPATVRHFLQLCLDGYYDNMVVHRVVPGLLIQTGAIRQHADNAIQQLDASAIQTYRQTTHADAAWERAKYELHPRLRFGHRGQVAMALALDDNSQDEDEVALLQPQFFVTTDAAPELDGKHVLFGTVAGPTLFHVLRMASIAVNEDTNEPLDLLEAPRIKSVSIVENPIFTDLVTTASVPWRKKEQAVKKKKKRKGTKNVNVLSFGDELEDDDGGGGDMIRMVPRLKKQKAAADDTAPQKESRQATTSVPTEKKSKPVVDDEIAISLQQQGQGQASVDEGRVLYEKKLSPPTAVAQELTSIEPPPQAKPKSSTSILEERLSKYKRGSRSSSSNNKKKKDDSETMNKLFAFQSKVRKVVAGASKTKTSTTQDNSLAARMARRAEEAQPDRTEAAVPHYHGQVLDDDDNDDVEHDNAWLGTKFKCRRHMDQMAGQKERGGDGRSMDDYEVIDERQERNGGEDKKRHKKHHKEKRHKR